MTTWGQIPNIFYMFSDSGNFRDQKKPKRKSKGYTHVGKLWKGRSVCVTAKVVKLAMTHGLSRSYLIFFLSFPLMMTNVPFLLLVL